MYYYKFNSVAEAWDYIKSIMPSSLDASTIDALQTMFETGAVVGHVLNCKIDELQEEGEIMEALGNLDAEMESLMDKLAAKMHSASCSKRNNLGIVDDCEMFDIVFNSTEGPRC